MVNNFAYGSKGLILTKTFERCELRAYQDSGGVWTVGWGHTGPGVHPGLVVSAVQAEILLKADLAAAVACVNHAVAVKLTQNQFDALADFTFNAGRASFLKSSLLRDLNRGDFSAVPSCFGMWVDCNGKPIPGLIRRRVAESTLFRTPMETA